MPRIAIAGMTTLLAVSQAAAQSEHPDLSGTWVMDATRSESAHQDIPIGPVTIIVKQSAGVITIETTRRAAKNSPAFHEITAYQLNGQESTAAGSAGAQVVAKAHWDGASLVTETTRNVENSTVTTAYAHTLSADGQELVIEKNLTVQHGYQFQGAKTTGHGKDVFVKKK